MATRNEIALGELLLGMLVTASRAGSSAARLAAYPARVVAPGRVDATEQRLASTGRRAALHARDALTDAAEDAVTGPELKRMIDELLERVLSGPELDRIVERVASSPALRAALTTQTSSYAEELRLLVRERTAALDDRVGKPSAVYGGLVARGIALSIDLVLVAAVAIGAAAAVGLVASLAGGRGPAWVVGLVLGSVWVLLADAYLVFFWTTLGQTPGMRLFGLRVTDSGGARPGLGRAVWRAVALALAIMPLFAGFLTIPLDGRRRGVHDMLAGTVVTYDKE
jgi:uncharacterized RDD family membrane protein YckC